MPHLIFAIGLAAVSSAPLLIRWALPAPPLWIAAGRVLLAGGVLCLLANKQLIEITKLTAADKRKLGVASTALAAHFALWIASLAYTSTTASVSIVATQPIFAGILGMLLLREGFQRRELLGMLVAGSGCVLLAGGDFGGSNPTALFGDALALGGAMTVPIYLLMGRSIGGKVPLLAYLAVVNLGAGALLATAALVAVGPVEIAPMNALAIVALAAIPSLIGHTALNHCVRHVPVHLVSLGILVEPVVATLSTWAVFGEVPQAHAWGGGIVIVFGIYVGFGVARSPTASRSR